MTHVRRLEQIGQNDSRWAGDKATRLAQVSRAQCDVPPAFVIGAPAYALHLEQNQIAGRIRSRLAEIEIEDPVELESAAEDIRAWIDQGAIPSSLQEEVSAALDNLAGGTFAVRASRIVEDVVNPRGSGLEQAFLGVPRDEVPKHIARIWGTLWTSRSMYYRHKKKVAPEEVTIAVLVQTMVPSTAAGILFTENPVAGAGDQILIDATYGLGEAIVAARWKFDHYVVSKRDPGAIEREIVDKPLQVLVDPTGGIQVAGVPTEQQLLPCLPDDKIRSLALLGIKIEEQFSQPQDIEWCLDGDALKILQTRPLRRK